MTQAEKLEALVRRAIENGLDDPEVIGSFYRDGSLTSYVDNHNAYWLIFNKDFARALFGDGEGGDYYKLNNPKRTKRKLWEHMLQEAVISRDPIGYMYEVVFGE